MASSSKKAAELPEEEVYRIIRERMEFAPLEKRIEMLEHFVELFFPKGSEDDGRKWISTESNSVTRVTLWGHKYFLNNLRLAMMQEKLGLGPKRYCVLRTAVDNFNSKLILVISNLPHEKICIFPRLPLLGGPFLHSPWKEIGEAICNRPPLDRKEHKVLFGFLGPEYSGN